MRNSSFWAEQAKIFAWGVLAWGLAYWLLRFLGSFSDSPWRVAVVLVPLAVVVVILGYPLWRQKRLILGGGFLFFFAAYCMLFAIADGTELLTGRRVVLTGYENATPRPFLGLTRLADWHYRVAPRPPQNADLIVIKLPTSNGRNIVEARRELASMVKTAKENGAKAIAFDYYLKDKSPVDRILCHAIKGAREGGTGVYFGTHLEERIGSLFRIPVPSSLECLDDDSLSSLAGYQEADGFVRMVPTSQPGDEDMPALSVRVARALEPDLDDIPALVQYLAPETDIATFEGQLSEEDAPSIAGKVVLVGSSRKGDQYETPFGLRQGVEIHALAANSLASEHFIRRLDRFWVFPALFSLCYVLTLFQASGGGVRRLVAAAGVLSVAVIAAAILAMRALVWVDTVYPIVAMWFLVALLSGGAALQRGRMQAHDAEQADCEDEPDADSPPDEPFDVFLAHNGVDKPAVRQLAEALEARGLRPWLDEAELPSGQRWRRRLTAAIRSSRAAAIIIGPDGLGGWQDMELDVCLDQHVKREMPVCPVLLPGAPDPKTLDLDFLMQFTWIDLREGMTKSKLNELVWDLTGIKPSRRGSSRQSGRESNEH